MLLVAALLFMGWQWRAASSDSKSEEKSDDNSLSAAAKPTLATDAERNTVAAHWDWSKFKTAHESIEGAEPVSAIEGTRFDVADIYLTLQRIKLDESGNLILDQVVLQALNNALLYADIDWTEEKLQSFQQIVQDGLPMAAGEQAVQIIGDYFHYLQARQEWFELTGNPPSAADSMAGFETLMALRRTYLGDDVANRLFAQEEAEARYMMQSMELAANRQLSAEERRQQQQSLYQQFANRAPDIPDWDARYQQFVADRSIILESGLGEEESRHQLKELMTQHFSLSEQAQAYHLQLDQLR